MTVIACLFVSVSIGVSDPLTPIELNCRKQLFLDDYLIESMNNVTRRIQVAQKHPANPVLRPQQEWEGPLALTHGSIIRDGDRYRMWYLSRPGVSYAESKDGILWSKPDLGLFEIEDHATNVVIKRGASPEEPNAIPYLYNTFGVLKDPRDKNPLRRYKMGFISIQRDYKGPREDLFHAGQRRGLGVATSPDGIAWTLVDNWASETICDGPGHWMWDEQRGKYALYGRTKYIPPAVRELWSQDDWCKNNCWGRAVTRIESHDFITWNMTDRGVGPVVMAPDAEDPVGTEIYSMHVFAYEGLYIGLIQVFHNQPDTCYLDIQLAVSRDGIRFARVADRSPFIEVGPIGSWDRFNHSIANNDPIVVGDELRFYYSGRTYRHSPYKGPDKGISGGRIGFATIQRDRFVSLGASFDGGQIVTRPIKLGSRTLHINAKANFGEILVEILDEQGRVIAKSVPIRADSLRVPVQWEDRNAVMKLAAARLRITLTNALLFAIWSE
jgi:hypothetical protein